MGCQPVSFRLLSLVVSLFLPFAQPHVQPEAMAKAKATPKSMIYPVPQPKAMQKSLRFPVPKPKAVPKSLRYPRSMDFQLEGVAGSAVLSASSGSNPPAASQSASSIAVTLTIDETHAAASLANTAAASQSSPAAVLEVTVFEDLTLALNIVEFIGHARPWNPIEHWLCCGQSCLSCRATSAEDCPTGCEQCLDLWELSIANRSMRHAVAIAVLRFASPCFEPEQEYVSSAVSPIMSRQALALVARDARFSPC